MSETILVVDDDTKVLEILERTLVKSGHQVMLATDGNAALELYRDRSPDMVVLDVGLPDMDGREVWWEMRRSGGAATPVLFLSGDSDTDTRIGLIDEGADLLVKPFSLREFRAKVRKVLANYHESRAVAATKDALESRISEQEVNYEQVNRELKRQLLSARTLFTVSQDINRRLDIEELINRFALTLVGELQVSSTAIFLRRRDRDENFSLLGLKGFDRRRLGDLEFSTKGKFADWIKGYGKPVKLARRGDEHWASRLPDVRLAVFEYVTPIIVKQNLKGVIFTGPKLNGSEYSDFEKGMLNSLCNSAGIGLDNARLFHELQNTYLSTVKALVSLIEAKDAYVKGHTERVADYAVTLARRMRLSRQEIRDITFAAVLHDIGKLVIYEGILNKPAKLSEEEWKILKRHPEVGASVIENMEFLSGTVALVRHHHEWWDGSGYPAGLKGDEIPIGARIIAVADSFDAMTTDRSYRKALSLQEALDVLRHNAGIQYDPYVVSHFIDMINDKSFHRPAPLRSP